MKIKKQKYSQEFIDSTVKLVEKAGNAAEVARELGIESWRVRSWVRKSKKETENGSGYIEMASELKQLKRELAKVKEENEILKKAAGYFARHQK